MTRVWKVTLILAAFVLVAGCEKESGLLSPTTDKNASGNLSLPVPQMDENQGMTIVEVAIAINEDTGEFSTLIAALTAADLVGALDDRKQFTVFAPTDAAFAALGLNPENIGELPVEDLSEILLYHVAKGRREAADVVMSDQIRMMSGAFTFITVNDDGAFINDAMIVQTDVMASNGVSSLTSRLSNSPSSGLVCGKSAICVEAGVVSPTMSGPALASSSSNISCARRMTGCGSPASCAT